MTTSKFASGYCIILVIKYNAVVFDFLLAREPLTTLYLPLKFQNFLYPFPTTSGRKILLTSLVFKCIIS